MLGNKTGIAALSTVVVLACVMGCGRKTHPIRLGTYAGLRESSTHLIHIHSPWKPDQYLSINFPEHCWGANLPNVSHDSPGKPIPSPWRISSDSTQALLERSTRPGVVFRAKAIVDSMAVRLSIEIENDSDRPISGIRTLVCLRPDRMTAFRDANFSQTVVAVGGEGYRLGIDTHYRGSLPEGRPVNWGLNLL